MDFDDEYPEITKIINKGVHKTVILRHPLIKEMFKIKKNKFDNLRHSKVFMNNVFLISLVCYSNLNV